MSFIFFKCLFIYFEKEKAGGSGGRAKRERERESKAGSTLSVQSPTQGLNSQTLRS